MNRETSGNDETKPSLGQAKDAKHPFNYIDNKVENGSKGKSKIQCPCPVRKVENDIKKYSLKWKRWEVYN